MWSAARWLDFWREADFLGVLILLELFPIVLAVELWQREFRIKRVCFHCNNLGVVQAINKVSTSPLVFFSFRHLVL